MDKHLFGDKADSLREHAPISAELMDKISENVYKLRDPEGTSPLEMAHAIFASLQDIALALARIEGLHRDLDIEFIKAVE